MEGITGITGITQRKKRKQSTKVRLLHPTSAVTMLSLQAMQSYPSSRGKGPGAKTGGTWRNAQPLHQAILPSGNIKKSLSQLQFDMFERFFSIEKGQNESFGMEESSCFRTGTYNIDPVSTRLTIYNELALPCFAPQVVICHSTTWPAPSDQTSPIQAPEVSTFSAPLKHRGPRRVERPSAGTNMLQWGFV